MGTGGVAGKPCTFGGKLEIAPRKKRTRTLITPHQAVVLQALLAQVCQARPTLAHALIDWQSLFPSTKTREMVGRSIGLSGRKVQVSCHCCLSSVRGFTISVRHQDLVSGEP